MELKLSGPFFSRASILLLLSVWATLYLPNLRIVPAWYGDENLALTAGLSLVGDRPVHWAFLNTFWHPYAPYQPAYLLAVGGAAKLFGGDILGARLFNALLALLVSLVLFFGGRNPLGGKAALFAALIFLTFEQSVVHFRWVFTHNLIALGFAICAVALLRKPSAKADWTAGGGLALGMFSLPLAVYGVPAALLARWKWPKSWLPLVAPFAIVLFASLLAPIFLRGGLDFLAFDLRETVRFYSEASIENGGGGRWLQNLLHFYSHDAFHIVAVLCVLISLAGAARPLGIFTICVSFLLLQNRQNLTVFYYQAVVLLPLLSLAMGEASRAAFAFLERRQNISGRFLDVLTALVFAVPFAFWLQNFGGVLSGRLPVRIAPWTTQSHQAVEGTARWINERVHPGDFVVCHQNIAWLLHCKTADLLQATTWSGASTWPFKAPIPKERFLFPADLAAARFLVIGDIDQIWSLHQPNISEFLQKSGVEGWPIVFQQGPYFVLENPRFASQPEPNS